jgi:hypothetical protein
VRPKAESAFSRINVAQDTTIGWRFVSTFMKVRCGVDPLPGTAGNLAPKYGIGRAAQDEHHRETSLEVLAKPIGVVCTHDDGRQCRRRSKSEPPCRLNIEPGVEADFEMVGCG